ncbi:bifunctional folylpolyglutamate synthase/dihydrofolate synthase [Weissella cibaria]|uniref:bifunctional folylpolyglutamate synthase/dihydrofolate synthase n=1 Tax=Weissella cibaria TaxID=137591 RepID=UPI0011305872|nr:folylpolyglutamate synthase/dihydrofolate synthase family protein [Weissella cibaria]QDG80612.1 bifunctional folylpolyglutamate synthase/dihydrofolate synthase [Weissella cibaria]TVV36620.1 bifunctional folylpolyglutamate synthase/dihydrofolate synthase [Weissella cibaria]UNW39460.1 bifunctional folylpolyglutamate synthase/dihydrofolate synthase [Weissella cibaria]
MITIETAADAIAYIHGRHKWKKTPSFARIEALLDRLDHPERASKFIHITGTNGKGSTSKMIAQLLRQTGLTVGMFTSPFIMTFNERVQGNDGNIPDADLLAIMQRIAPITEALDQELPDGGPTEFETLTAMMFVYFAEHPVDVVVLEVGVGGTWDTTEVIPDKLLSVITTVGLDHMQVLGDSLAEIATQKAGIIQRQRPVVTGRLPEEARQVVTTVAHAAGATIFELGHEFEVAMVPGDTEWGERFNLSGTVTQQNVFVDLMGDYQIENAAVAIQAATLAAQLLGRELTPEMVETALAIVTWPVRFERVSNTPLTVLDGAHNQHGVDALAATLARRFKRRTVHILFGALADKAYPEMLHTLADLPNVDLHVVSFQNPGSRTVLDPSEAAAQVTGHTVTVHQDWQTAYQTVKALAKQNDMILFTGSLYFVSEVRANL